MKAVRDRKGVLLLCRCVWLLFFSLVIDVNTRTSNKNALLVESFVTGGSSYLHSRRLQKETRQQLLCQQNESQNDNRIRFLGKGPNAIVREGVVLLAPAEEFHHYLRQSAVFIYAMGLDDNDDYVVRGVILDNPTPFTIGEMMTTATEGGIYESLIYRGGESGGQEAFCLHSVKSMDLEEIGTSGIYQGGDLEKLDQSADTSDDDNEKRIKFFFNYMEFLEQELEDMLEIVHEDGDGWISVEVPSEIVLDSECDKGEIWSRLRNAVREKIVGNE